MHEKFVRDAYGLSVCGLWVWVALDELFLKPWWLPILVVGSLYAVTIFLIRRLLASGGQLHVITLIACALTMGLVIFTAWGNVLAVPVPAMPGDYPLGVRLLPLFLTGVFAALLLAIALSYPVAALIPRAFWLPSLIAALLVGILQFDSLMSPDVRAPTRYIMVYELLVLALLTPLMLRLIGRRLFKAMPR